MEESKENKPSRSSKINMYDQVAIGEMLEVIVEFTNHVEESEDSFDNYAHQLMGRVLSKAPHFESRVIEGYETLMETLAESHFD